MKKKRLDQFRNLLMSIIRSDRLHINSPAGWRKMQTIRQLLSPFPPIMIYHSPDLLEPNLTCQCKYASLQ